MPENVNDAWDEEPTIQNNGEGDDAKKKVSVATQIVEMAMDSYQLGVSEEGEPYAVEIGGPNIASLLRGGRSSLRAKLASRYMDVTGRAASASALADAMCVLEGKAAQGEPTPLPLRIARHGDSIVIDIGDPSGRAVVIDEFGWEVVERSPVCFRRSALTLPLPTPVSTGIDIMKMQLLNITPRSWPLVVGWLVAALIPEIPHPILFPKGEQGTGKTTTASVLSRLIDPSPAPVRAAPRDLEQWVVAASGSWMVAIDNISAVPAWLSDALCRGVTGEGLVRRQLYTDGDLSVLCFRRAVILTAIDAGSLRGDLADRLVTLELERIDPSCRRTDADLEAEFDRRHPELFGALLDLVAKVLRELPHVHLDGYPRMADFARVLAACDAVTLQHTLPLYLVQSEELAGDVIDDDTVMVKVRDLVVKRGSWTGTAGELLEIITPDPRPKGWPGGPHVLVGHLKRSAPAMRAVGIGVEFRRDGRRRIIDLAVTGPTEKARNGASRASQASSTHADHRVRGDGTGDAPEGEASQASPPASPPASHETAGQGTGDACDAPIPPSSVHDHEDRGPLRTTGPVLDGPQSNPLSAPTPNGADPPGATRCDRCGRDAEYVVKHHANGQRWCPSCCRDAGVQA